MSATDQQPDLSGRDRLLVQVLEASTAQTRAATDAVIAGLEYRAAHAEARLGLIIEQVQELLDKPYMPATHVLQRALYPSAFAVRQRIEADRRVDPA